jgi:hypothetical protein
MAVAGLVATAVVGPSVFGALTRDVVLVGLGLAVLLPVVPFSLELLALRRLTTAAFGTLMSLEPAIALVIGFAVLHQAPGLAPVAGIVFVVIAGIGAERAGARRPADEAEDGRRAPNGSARRSAPSRGQLGAHLRKTARRSWRAGAPAGARRPVRHGDHQLGSAVLRVPGAGAVDRR